MYTFYVMKKLIVGNWKMNPRTEREALKLCTASSALAKHPAFEMWVAPPALFLGTLMKRRGKIVLGAQDGFPEESGAFTGGISMAMLAETGARFVIVGHSERRNVFKETDMEIARKVEAAARAGLTAILCVGEPLAVRKKGEAAANSFLSKQLRASLHGVSPKLFKKVIVAYEPVWAIGTGANMGPALAAWTILNVKEAMSRIGFSVPRMLYGGSVDEKNAGAYLALPVIDGLLVGGASSDLKKMSAFTKAIARHG